MHHHVFWLEIVFILLAFIAMWFAVSNFSSVKRIFIGRPLRSKELHAQHTKLFWIIALPILSADLYSSVAYGPEAGMTELVGLGASAKWFILPITISTILLLAILITSYIMGVIAYPSGGGAYAIAKDNFSNPLPSLIASSSLLIDYILTVAVSVSAAVEAVSSAYPAVGPYETIVAIVCVCLLVIINLRGVAESAKIFAWPTFLFMACMLLLIVVGLTNEASYGFVQPATPPIGQFPPGVTVLLLLKAFSSACSALTGIETISNAVPVFREPQQKSAIKTYIALGVVTAITLMGFAYHLYVQGITPDIHNTMLSQLAGVYYGHGPMYQILIWSTFIVLILAANSTFTGFSQLAAIVATDGFLPRALTNRGDRLGYSNGIIVLAGLAIVLIVAFRAHTNALIPLYAIGVFLSFTVAQLGLLRRWKRVRGPKWGIKFVINLVGFIITALVAVIFAVTKFIDGAWLVLIVLPIIVFLSMMIKRHYNQVAQQLKIDPAETRPGAHRVITIVLVSGVHRVVSNTLSFAKSLGTELVAVHVGFDHEDIEKMEQKWEEWGNPCRLVVLRSSYRSILEPISRFIQALEKWEGEEPGHIHIVVPQFIPKKWWQNILHNQSALLLRAWFFWNKDVVITTVPYHLQK
ncbi:APC family permease [Paenibacillus cremeus]|uniref:APC family permease n=1 Tax=Paenibacillus cremeus TaxID=2163881 RepID=A0A559KAT2_9BACL|nr:APC family permease [Paenibacillus cremeus]TVY09235.1 APC family permease [Paenibacillus cremeus]